MNNILNKIIEEGQVIKVEKGHYLYYRGDTAENFYVVLRGMIDLTFFDHHGKEVIFRSVRKNEYFGEIEVFRTGIRNSNAFIKAPVELISISKLAISNIIKENSEIALFFIENLCFALDSNIEYIQETICLSAYERICKKLHDISLDNDSYKIRITQAELASHTAITRQTTNECIQKLIEKNVIDWRKSEVEILNRDFLKDQFYNKIGM